MAPNPFFQSSQSATEYHRVIMLRINARKWRLQAPRLCGCLLRQSASKRVYFSTSVEL